MRSQLVPFEGKQVLFQGHLSEWRKREDEHHLCLMNVSIKEFKMDKPLNECPSTRLDHLWMSFPEEQSPFISKDLYTRRNGIAKVYYYTRSDGSLDLSLRSIHAVCVDYYLNLIHQYMGTSYNQKSTVKFLEQLDQLFAFYDEGKTILYSTVIGSCPISDVIELIIDKSKRIRRDFYSNEDRLKTVKNYGKPTGISLFKSNRTIIKTKVGFAA
jgi:hypothetical protein